MKEQARIRKGWIEDIITADKFTEYEHEAMKSLKKGYERCFIAQCFPDKDDVYFSELSQGGDRGIELEYLVGHDANILNVHYHPSGDLRPSKGDLQDIDKNSIELKNFIGSPPVYMIGAKNGGKMLYVASQGKDFPGIMEKWTSLIMEKAYLEIWKPFRHNRFKREIAKRINDELQNLDADEYFRYDGDIAVTKNGFQNVARLIGHEKIAKIVADSLERVFDYKTGIVETYKGKPAWLYGSAKTFD